VVVGTTGSRSLEKECEHLVGEAVVWEPAVVCGEWQAGEVVEELVGNSSSGLWQSGVN
jgi:hypothetical protein